jgi:cyclophilin family peptidyl-prolyl cis-trans isomerase
MLRKPRLTALTVVVMFAFAAALAACGGAEPSTGELGSPGAQPVETTSTLPTAPVEPPLHVSTQKVTGKEKAVLTTDKGVIEIEFYADKAPNTTASFIELVNQKFYDGTTFHRVEPGLLIQGGDPLSKTDSPAVGSGDPGWRLKAEFNDISHAAGVVAMARTADPDTAGSQFYICLSPLTQLDRQYTVFGHVVKGMDVANEVTVGTVITSVKIVSAP